MSDTNANFSPEPRLPVSSEKNPKCNTNGLITLSHVSESKRKLARIFRKNQTPAEAALWKVLRNRGFKNLKFRRQQVIDGFIADFYCEELRLVIEVDGKIHLTEEQIKIDILRDEVFERRKIVTIRLTNEEVLDGSWMTSSPGPFYFLASSGTSPSEKGRKAGVMLQ